MKQNNIRNWICFVTALLITIACKEDLSYREPSGADGGVPGLVKDVQVLNLSGKAKIIYTVPADPNLLYVKAVYTLSTGKMMEVKASYYSDSLMVVGFADTLEHEVKLYSVSRREVFSSPISISVKPYKAPIRFVRESIEVVNAFGGYKLTAINKTQAAVAVLVMERNIFKEWEVNNNLSIYTSGDTIVSKVSGLDTLIHSYAIAIRDQWGNVTDTLFKDVKPIYEVELSTSKFSHFPLPGDQVQQPGASVANMWNKRYGWPVSFTSLAAADLVKPSIVTFDMGITAKLSKVWIRPFKELSNLFYDFTTMKRFEIWGATSPNLNGSLDGSWKLLGTYILKKPSGSPGKNETAEDIAAAEAGFFWEVDLNAPKVRYLRIKCLENFAGAGPQSVDEIKVLGDPR